MIPYAAAISPDTVPMERWGKDHWSTLLYLETRAVDHRGHIANANMRCDARRHRPFAHAEYGMLMDGSGYPTMLADGTLEGHDDWDCAQDLADHGLVRLWWTDPPGVGLKSSMFGYAKATVEITERGMEVVGRLRSHRAAGHRVAEFRWTEVSDG